MAQYEIRPLQLHILKIAEAFHKVCQEHNLRYYMLDGTLIGAMREKGFIPWDDDMDLGMPRPDYEQLIAHSKEWLPENLEFVCYENDPHYPLQFGKLQDAGTTLIERPHLFYLGGVFIDIFPIDGAPEGWLAQRLYVAKYKYLRKMLYFLFRDPYRHGHGPSSWLPLLVRKMYTMPKLQAKIKKYMTKYPFEKSNTVAANLEDFCGSMINKNDTLGNPTLIKFEGKEFYGMKDNDAYLHKLFGDYMTPPPMNSIHQHNFYLLDLELPYREYAKREDALKPYYEK